MTNDNFFICVHLIFICGNIFFLAFLRALRAFAVNTFASVVGGRVRPPYRYRNSANIFRNFSLARCNRTSIAAGELPVARLMSATGQSSR